MLAIYTARRHSIDHPSEPETSPKGDPTMIHRSPPRPSAARERFVRLVAGVGFVCAAVGWLIVNDQRRRARIAIRNALLRASPEARTRLRRVWLWWKLRLADPWGRCRARLVADAVGDVLEIGVGRWPNLKRYHSGDQLVGVEPNRRGVFLVRRRIRRFRPDAQIVYAPLERLPFAGASFDTVVSSLALCTARDQAATLAEIARVLRPGGRFLFLEHVRARHPLTAWLQRAVTPLWSRLADGCHLDRDTLAAIEAAGFAIERAQPTVGGWWLARPTYHGVATPPHQPRSLRATITSEVV
jgi:SAM-dependent methyltransferase